MIVLGADPGLTGAIAAVCSLRGLLAVEDLPTCSNGLESGSWRRWLDIAELRVLLAAWSVRYDFAREHVSAIIERPIAMPGLPAQTIAAQFDLFGALRGALIDRGLPTTYVNPRAWKAHYGLGNDKNASRTTAQKLYPDAPLHRVRDHNRAEAILIARYWLREAE